MCVIVFDQAFDSYSQKDLVDNYLHDSTKLVFVIESEYEPTLCLCNVDVEKTLANVGVHVKYDDFGWQVVRE